MNLKQNWKGIYEYICGNRALVLWKKNLPGRGPTKVEKHCSKQVDVMKKHTLYSNIFHL